jgi:hypothetical protein
MKIDELENLPDSALVGEEDAGIFLGGKDHPIKKTTLSVWRSTDRYNLKYVKVGRCVRYCMRDLRQFLASRTRTHTAGEGK